MFQKKPIFYPFSVLLLVICGIKSQTVSPTDDGVFRLASMTQTPVRICAELRSTEFTLGSKQFLVGKPCQSKCNQGFRFKFVNPTNVIFYTAFSCLIKKGTTDFVGLQSLTSTYIALKTKSPKNVEDAQAEDIFHLVLISEDPSPTYAIASYKISGSLSDPLTYILRAQNSGDAIETPLYFEKIDISDPSNIQPYHLWELYDPTVIPGSVTP